jgi:hypothetical protein
MLGRARAGHGARYGYTILRITVSAAWLFFGFGSAVVAPVQAMAQSSAPPAGTETPIPFDIPAQPLARALVAYGAATGLDIFYDADLAEKQRSTEVHGLLGPSDALQMLLLGTGYGARSTRAGVVTILRLPQAAPAGQAAPIDAAIYRPYFATIQARISDALCQDADVASRADEILFRFWLAPSGAVARAEVIGDDGKPTEDQTLAAAIHGLAIGVPPSGMPQPVNMVILPPSRTSGLCRSTQSRKGMRAESRAP